MAQSNQKVENLRVLLEQHWLHCRHLESERAWFMNAYVVVVGVVAAFIAGRGLEISLPFYFLLSFLVVFTFVGLFLTTRWIYAFECHRIRVNKLASILWLSCNVEVPLDPTMEIPPLHVMPRCLRKADEIFRTRYWFALFYLFILIGLVILSSVGYFRHNFSVWLLVLAGLALIVGFCLLRRWWISLARLDKPKKVILAGCNGEWAQKHYLPFLIEKAMIGDITLWAIDVQSGIKLDSPASHSLWRIAGGKGRAHYLNKGKLNEDKVMKSLGIHRNVDYVFILTPDRCHCEVAEFWLSRLSTNGKVFIEKPLDASTKAVKQLKTKILNKDVVYGFDHYLASLYPFLRRERQYLTRIGEIESLEIKIWENTGIPSEKADTLKEGVILDLFPHVLAVSAAVVEGKLAPTEGILQNLQKAGCTDGARAKYKGWPFSSETCARIEFFVGDKKVTGRVGKGIGREPDKRMVIHGTNGGNIEIDFQNYSVDGKDGDLDSKHVESFLETVLAGSSIDSAPGVLSFGAAFAILKWLSDSRGRIKMRKGPGYNIGAALVKPCQ